LDTEFVDVVGLSSVREHQYIHALHNGTGTGVIRQTADDVIISNLDVKIFGSDTGTGTTRPAAYYPDTNLSSAKIINCRFGVDIGQYSMRFAIEYSGYYNNIDSGNFSFGSGGGGTFSGTAYNCIAGNNGFGGGGGTFSGTAYNCIAGNSGF